MPVFSSLWFPEADQRPMAGLWALTTLMFLANRIAGLWVQWRGKAHVHSLYVGTAWVRSFRGAFEVLAAIIGGGCLLGVSPPVGAWFILAGICLWITKAYVHDAQRARVRQARDARWDAQYMAERLREEDAE
jgi:hypothetical protein